ncbi:unnamed protein product, partial [Ectocarpus sp. 12 AP-2014]
ACKSPVIPALIYLQLIRSILRASFYDSVQCSVDITTLLTPSLYVPVGNREKYIVFLNNEIECPPSGTNERQQIKRQKRRKSPPRSKANLGAIEGYNIPLPEPIFKARLQYSAPVTAVTAPKMAASERNGRVEILPKTHPSSLEA